MRQRLIILAILAAAVLAGVQSLQLVEPGGAGAAPPPLLAADADPSGNGATLVGAVDTCREVTAAQVFKVDFVFKGAPPMFNAEFNLHYDGAILRIDSLDVASLTTLFLTKEGSTSLFNFSESGPDSDGRFVVGIFDNGFTGPSDDGAVVRLNVTALATGTSTLTIGNPIMLDVNGNDITDQFTFANSEIRVGSACPTVSGHFDTSYSTQLNTTAAAGSGNSRADSGLPSAGHPPTPIKFMPPAVTVTPGSAIPIGKITGSLTYSLFVGVLNSDCSSPFVPTFTLRNASTDIRDTITPMPEGTFNGLGNLRQDVRGATPGSAPNGIPDYLDSYPSFLNTMFDPDDSDVSGNSPIYPLRPLARYAGDTNIADTDVIIQLLVFGRDALTQFANAGASHPWQQFTDDFGYASVTVVQDPTRSAAPATITDLCAPLSSATALSATTDPELGLISNQCDDASDDDDNYPDTAVQDTDGLINDGCPRIGNAETGAECLNAIDDGEDAPADGAINDGCPANTAGTAENADCANATDDDGDGTINDGCPLAGDAAETDCASGEAAPLDDDFDGFVNDGCPQVTTTSEDQLECVAGEASPLDDDSDGLVNDGCPPVASLSESGEECTGSLVTTLSAAIDNTVTTIPVVSTAGFPSPTGTIQISSEIISYTGTTGTSFTGVTRGALSTTPAAHAMNDQVSEAIDEDLDGAINDGCPVAPGSVSESPALFTPQCSGGADDDADASANDGCPQIGSAPETVAQCTGGLITTLSAAIDDTVTTIPVVSTTSFPSSGTIQILSEIISYTGTTGTSFTGVTRGALSTTPAAHAISDQVSEAIDDDLDGAINDGCPTVGSDTLTLNPPAGSGLFRTNTHRYLSFDVKQRDADGDGIDNDLDTCPFTADNDGDSLDEGPGAPDTTPWDPSSPVHLAGQDDDNDKIPAGCDANSASGGTDVDADGILNTQDNCPQVANADQVESESKSSLSVAAPDGGPATDSIGDACEGLVVAGNALGLGDKFVADGHYHATLHTVAVCFDPGVDTDGDGWCDATETILGSINGASTPAGESGAQCANNRDDDSDGTVNDGCPANTAGAPETDCAAGEALPLDDDTDGIINDGCPTNAAGTPEGAVLNSGLCAGNADDDGDTIVNDGCPTDGSSETGDQCANAIDDDDGGTGPVNEGCPTALVSVAETGAQCADPFDIEDNYPTTTADVGDGLVNDGCPTALTSVAETGDQCLSGLSATDDEDNYAPAPGVQLDGLINDGCPGVSTPEHVAVDYQLAISNPGATRIATGDSREGDGSTLTGQCDSSADVPAIGVDDDADGVVNDGCVANSTAESGADCLNSIDDDADGDANDGCPVVNNGVAQTCSDGIDNDGDGLTDQDDPGCAAALTPDVDADGVCNSTPAVAGKCVLVTGNGATPDGVDNCPTQSNPGQANTDFDLAAAGADVGHGSLTPVALPGDADGNACDDDDDNDSWTGNSFVSINGATTGVCRTSGDAPVFRDCIEYYLGSDPLDNCPDGGPDAPPDDDAWPVDINRGTGSLGIVNSLDTGAGGFVPLQTAQDLRGDFNADLSVNLFDAFLLVNNGPLSDSYGTKVCT